VRARSVHGLILDYEHEKYYFITMDTSEGILVIPVLYVNVSGGEGNVFQGWMRGEVLELSYEVCAVKIEIVFYQTSEAQ
jgi:hypothetical protein